MPAKPGTKPLKKLKPGMGLYQVMKGHGCPTDKPWAVVNLETGDVAGRCHVTREDGLAQARAMYANLGDKAKVHSEGVTNAYFFSADPALLFDGSDQGIKWVEAMAPKDYHTVGYGVVPIKPEQIDNFIHNLNNNVRDQEVATDYEHGIDRSKGNKASGWIRGARKNQKGNLELAIEFTEPARQEIINKEWKYFSLEWEDEWQHPDGTIYRDVITGGALTNRPVAKGLMPINFSEVFTEVSDYEFADWSTAYKNSLPDSSFAYIEPGGHKDSEGKTEPRSLRHFPYKDASGKVDLGHVRKITQLAPKSKVPDAIKSRVIAMAERILKSKSMSELMEMDKLWDNVTAEQKELEHSEPGTGTPPAPRTDEDGSDDDAIRGGWRRELPPAVVDPDYVPGSNGSSTTVTSTASVTPAVGAGDNVTYPTTTGGNYPPQTTDIPKGGNVPTMFEIPEKDAQELLRALDLPVDADGVKVVETVKLKFGELAELKSREAAQDQEKAFAEKYPQYWTEHKKLMERDRETRAVMFTESVTRIRKAEGYGLKETKQALSPQAKEKVAELHKKFSEGTPTVEDFEECIKEITNGGIVQFGELGSAADDDSVPEIDTSTATGVAAGRKLFAEIADKIQREHEDWDYLKCVEEAAKKHPDLYDAYNVALPA